MDVQTVDASSARAEEARWDDFASTSTTWHWEGSLRVAEEAMSLLFILAHLEAARLRMSPLSKSSRLQRKRFRFAASSG
jgi:hypothetical protein